MEQEQDGTTHYLLLNFIIFSGTRTSSTSRVIMVLSAAGGLAVVHWGWEPSPMEVVVLPVLQIQGLLKCEACWESCQQALGGCQGSLCYSRIPAQLCMQCHAMPVQGVIHGMPCSAYRCCWWEWSVEEAVDVLHCWPVVCQCVSG